MRKIRAALISGALCKRRPRGSVRRAQILDTATAVFLKHGYAGTTLELIVAKAGASKATIYSFFGDKDGLFAALIEERAGRILAGFPEIVIGNASVPTMLTHIARQYLDVAMNPDAIGLYRLILAEGLRFPKLVHNFYRVGQDRVAARLTEALRSWARQGLLDANDPARIATQFLDVIRGELYLRVLAGLPPDDLAAAIEKNIHDAVQTFWRAISPRARR